jgi:tetratricopeptide (TPR) repeat protein
MLAIGTKHDYYDAVWVKNEWSRFISMMGGDSSKVLIPCFKNMDAYDMPKEFKNMQALDMGDVTFFASLTANINRLLPKQKEIVKETVVTGGNANVDSLLKRVFIFLEDEDWESADEYCEKVLDIDPENGQAYLGKLMGELRVSNKVALKNVAQPFNDRNNYQKVMRYGDEALSAIDHLNEYVMISLRTSRGIDLDFIEERYGEEQRKRVELSAEAWMASGALQRADNRVVIPSERLLLSDAIIESLFA